MAYAAYLRKSRVDIEAEANGAGDTLKKHEKELVALSKKMGISIGKFYREVVSGESISGRPEAQQLLSDVAAGIWEGVLVVEIERLARGDTIDQGLIAQTFKFSSTKIVTPSKIYNPDNEFDEEYFEFGLFMSRREYKTINRRLQAGRLRSVNEGKYVGTSSPYGYIKKKISNDKGFTLEPHPEQADIVRLIFELYTKGEINEDGAKRLGAGLIANRLNEMEIKPKKSDIWTEASVRGVLKNPVYAGKIRWNWRPEKKKMIDGQVIIERPINENAHIVNGLHPAIVDADIFYFANRILKSNPVTPVNNMNVIKNPLAGLIICGKCGHSMTRKATNKGYSIVCRTTNCSNISSYFFIVEEKLMIALDQLLSAYKLSLSNNINLTSGRKSTIIEKQIKSFDIELETLSKQKDKIYNLLEQGIYTTEVFVERSGVVSERISEIKTLKDELEKKYRYEKGKSDSNTRLIPKIEKVLEVYHTLQSAQAKNDLLKDVLDKVVYTKDKSGKFKGVDTMDFELRIYPKILY
jgi:site-specific DNA recombinase